MIYIISFIVAVLIFWIIIQKLFFGKENKFLGDLAKEIDCNYENPKIGSGKIKGNYKDKKIEIGVYEGLGNFIEWNRETLSLFSADFLERMRNRKILGIKIIIKKAVERPQKIQSGMIVIGNRLFYILKGKSRFLSFGSENIGEVKESLEKAVEEVKQLEIR